MVGRLQITHTEVDGTATGDWFTHDLVMDVRDHRVMIDHNGTVVITISGTVGRRPATGFEPSTTT